MVYEVDGLANVHESEVRHGESSPKEGFLEGVRPLALQILELLEVVGRSGREGL